MGGIPCERYGRRITLYWIGILYFVSAVGSALASDPYIFSLFRFIGGLGVGASTIAAPAYISEISGKSNRGRLVGLYQFNVVFGILIAFISNYLLKGIGGANDWRWMLGVEAIPAGIYIAMILKVPESPRWLIIKHGDYTQASRTLEEINGKEEAKQIMASISSHNEETKGEPTRLFSKRYSVPLFLSFSIAFFNQASGINFILYYAPEILEKAGFAASDSLFSSISIGGVNLVFTMLGIYLIDRMGRKLLMYIGSIGYILSLSGISYAFLAGSEANLKLIFILMFIASHAIGQGAVIWVFISEIFPNKVRSFGQAWGSGTHWVFAALITLFGAVLISTLNPWIIFALFGVLMVFQLLFVAFLMPETKGISLESLEDSLSSPKGAVGSHNVQLVTESVLTEK